MNDVDSSRKKPMNVILQNKCCIRIKSYFNEPINNYSNVLVLVCTMLFVVFIDFTNSKIRKINFECSQTTIKSYN